MRPPNETTQLGESRNRARAAELVKSREVPVLLNIQGPAFTSKTELFGRLMSIPTAADIVRRFSTLAARFVTHRTPQEYGVLSFKCPSPDPTKPPVSLTLTPLQTFGLLSHIHSRYKHSSYN